MAISEVKVLIEGYGKGSGDNWVVSPSTVLIRDSGLNVLVDPGTNRDTLLKALSMEGLEPDDIDLVFITHYHPDHVLNIRLFPDKDVLEGGMIHRGDKEIEFTGNIPNTNIRIIETPGHAHEHTSLLVETEKGRVAVAGDVFWWTDDEEQKTDTESLLKHEDPFVKDRKALMKSRKKLLEIADYIIPGHGKMFKVERRI